MAVDGCGAAVDAAVSVIETIAADVECSGGLDRAFGVIDATGAVDVGLGFGRGDDAAAVVEGVAAQAERVGAGDGAVVVEYRLCNVGCDCAACGDLTAAVGEGLCSEIDIAARPEFAGGVVDAVGVCGELRCGDGTVAVVKAVTADGELVEVERGVVGQTIGAGQVDATVGSDLTCVIVEGAGDVDHAIRECG